jgi:hypothetical protein
MSSSLYTCKGSKALGIDLKEVNVRFYPNGTGVPTWETEGGIASVAWTATGKFLITLTDSFLKVRDAQVSYRDERDNVDLYAQLGPVSNEGTTSPVTIVVKLKTGTANTDTAAGAGARDRAVYCNFVFEDSTN